MAVDSETYWAAEPDDETFGAKLKEVIESVDEAAITKTVLEEQRNAYLQLFSISLQGGSSSSRLTAGGQEGELATFRVPLASALSSAVVNLITNQKITWQCTATNADAASRAQTTLGNQAVEYYWHDKGGERFAKALAEEGVPFGEAFGFIEFDEHAGSITGVSFTPPPAEGAAPSATPTPQYEGDIRFNVVSSWNTKRDPRAATYDDSPWVALRLRRNKWDLVAKHGPEVLEACGEQQRGILPTSEAPSYDGSKSDLVDVWYWFHKCTPAMPLGGQAVIIGDRVFARDQLRYKLPGGEPCVPVVRFWTGNLTGTPYPFAPFWTALASQELQDSILSSIATNNLAFSTQMIGVTAGTELEPESFGPMRMLTVPAGGMAPAPVQLTKSPEEAFKLYDVLKVDQRQLLGLNGSALGQPEGANLSGAAMALQSSMAIQANSSPQANWVDAVKLAGNIVVGIFQTFFSVERKIRIGGKAMGYMAKDPALQSDGVKGVNGVSVRVANPLSQTTVGREQLFDKFMKLQAASGGTVQILKTPEDVQQLLDTGRIEGLTDATRDQAILVEEENEALARGEPVTAWLGDDDVYHGKHHRVVYLSLEARKDEALMHNVLDHLHMHYANAFGTDPTTDPPDIYRLNMMTLMGVVPPMTAAPPPPGMGGLPGAPSAAPPPGPPEPEGLPSMPENPATGQEFDPQTGGALPPGE